MADRFGGIVVKHGEIHHKDGSGPVLGAHATVDTAGEIDKRFTATRLLLTGPFALAWRKKKDRRELYIVVEGQGFAFVESVDPKKGAEARKFAARINTLGAQAPAAPPPAVSTPTAPAPPPPPPPSVPASWAPDPYGRHELRYWDGSRWTEHVSDAGVSGIEEP